VLLLGFSSLRSEEFPMVVEGRMVFQTDDARLTLHGSLSLPNSSMIEVQFRKHVNTQQEARLAVLTLREFTGNLTVWVDAADAPALYSVERIIGFDNNNLTSKPSITVAPSGYYGEGITSDHTFSFNLTGACCVWIIDRCWLLIVCGYTLLWRSFPLCVKCALFFGIVLQISHITHTRTHTQFLSQSRTQYSSLNRSPTVSSPTRSLTVTRTSAYTCTYTYTHTLSLSLSLSALPHPLANTGVDCLRSQQSCVSCQGNATCAYCFPADHSQGFCVAHTDTARCNGALLVDECCYPVCGMGVCEAVDTEWVCKCSFFYGGSSCQHLEVWRAVGVTLIGLFFLMLILLLIYLIPKMVRRYREKHNDDHRHPYAEIPGVAVESAPVLHLPGHRPVLVKPLIPWSEVQLKEEIGSGATASVYRAMWRGTYVAVKQFNFPEGLKRPLRIRFLEVGSGGLWCFCMIDVCVYWGGGCVLDECIVCLECVTALSLSLCTVFASLCSPPIRGRVLCVCGVCCCCLFVLFCFLHYLGGTPAQ
jgi:hypothetical protein